jgi:hypothetical protein
VVLSGVLSGARGAVRDVVDGDRVAGIEGIDGVDGVCTLDSEGEVELHRLRGGLGETSRPPVPAALLCELSGFSSVVFSARGVAERGVVLILVLVLPLMLAPALLRACKSLSDRSVATVARRARIGVEKPTTSAASYESSEMNDDAETDTSCVESGDAIVTMTVSVSVSVLAVPLNGGTGMGLSGAARRITGDAVAEGQGDAYGEA